MAEVGYQRRDFSIFLMSVRITHSVILSDSLRLGLRLRLSIGQFEPISGQFGPHFLHM